MLDAARLIFVILLIEELRHITLFCADAAAPRRVDDADALLIRCRLHVAIFLHAMFL